MPTIFSVDEVTIVSKLGGIVDLIVLLIVFFLFVAFIVGLTFLYLHFRKYKHKIVFLKKFNEQYIIAGYGRAKEIRLTDSGDVIFWIPKVKRYTTYPKYSIGINKWMFYVKDGQKLINLRFQNIDERMNELKFDFSDNEIDVSRDGIQKLMKDKYNKITFLDRYGGMIAWTLIIFVTGIMFWFILDKFITYLDRLGGIAGSINEMIDKLNILIEKVNNIQSSGGVRSV